MWRKNYIRSLLSVPLLVLFATGNVQAQGNVQLSPDTLTVAFLKDINGVPDGLVSLSLISGDSDTNLFEFRLALADLAGVPSSAPVFISPTSATISSVNVIDAGGFFTLTFLLQVPDRVDLQLATTTSSAVAILAIQFSDTPAAITFFNQTSPVDSVTATVIVGVEVGIDIDIKPGSDPNCFNINGNGVIPVAILGSDTFDVLDIDTRVTTGTLFFAGLEVRVRGKKGPLCHGEDSNGDGFLDLVCQFEDDPTMWTPDSTAEATLAGTLLDGTEFEGTDSICVTQEVEEMCPGGELPPCQ